VGGPHDDGRGESTAGAVPGSVRPIGRPSIPPEQLFLALVGGYLLGITSERKLVMELQCNMALRWFVGLNLDDDAWDASTFSQNRRRRTRQTIHQEAITTL
jgi:transposase